MTQFVWRIDSKNYLSSKGAQGDDLPTKTFITQVCKRLDDCSSSHTLEELKSGKIPHCHSHIVSTSNKDKTEDYLRLVKKLKDINTTLGSGPNPTQLSEEDILQISLDNISDRFRCFGYVLNNVFYLIYLDPYHKVYKHQKHPKSNRMPNP